MEPDIFKDLEELELEDRDLESFGVLCDSEEELVICDTTEELGLCKSRIRNIAKPETNLWTMLCKCWHR